MRINHLKLFEGARRGVFASVVAVATSLTLLFAVSAAAATPQYDIHASVTHLGEVIAQPRLIVRESETARIHRESPPNYTMGLLVRPHVDDEVFLSMDFWSGQLQVQEDLVIPLNEPYQLVTEKLLIDFRVTRLDTDRAE